MGDLAGMITLFEIVGDFSYKILHAGILKIIQGHKLKFGKAPDHVLFGLINAVMPDHVKSWILQGIFTSFF